MFESAREGVRDELRDYPDDLKDPDHLRREVVAYGRLLVALDELVLVPDVDMRDLVGDRVHIIDRVNEYSRVDTVIKLAGSLGIPPEELLDGMGWDPGGTRIGQSRTMR